MSVGNPEFFQNFLNSEEEILFLFYVPKYAMGSDIKNDF